MLLFLILWFCSADILHPIRMTRVIALQGNTKLLAKEYKHYHYLHSLGESRRNRAIAEMPTSLVALSRLDDHYLSLMELLASDTGNSATFFRASPSQDPLPPSCFNGTGHLIRILNPRFQEIWSQALHNITGDFPRRKLDLGDLEFQISSSHGNFQLFSESLSTTVDQFFKGLINALEEFAGKLIGGCPGNLLTLFANLDSEIRSGWSDYQKGKYTKEQFWASILKIGAQVINTCQSCGIFEAKFVSKAVEIVDTKCKSGPGWYLCTFFKTIKAIVYMTLDKVKGIWNDILKTGAAVGDFVSAVSAKSYYVAGQNFGRAILSAGSAAARYFVGGGFSSVQNLYLPTSSRNEKLFSLNPPADWNCSALFYADNDGCDCECGAWDPDCAKQPPVLNCNGSSPQCVVPGICEVQATPISWNCSASWYNSSDGCDCGCGIQDPDCDVNNTELFGCYEGLYPQCLVGICSYLQPLPLNWNCSSSFYNASDGCDCDCGAYDPDCDDHYQEIFNCYNGVNPTCLAGICIYRANYSVPSSWICGPDEYGDGLCQCTCGAADPDCINGGPIDCPCPTMSCDSTFRSLFWIMRWLQYCSVSSW